MTSNNPIKTALMVVITTASSPALYAETREAVAGAEYERSAFHNLWWGENYRALWTAPVQIEVLDLANEAGGLEIEREVGGAQTPGLAIKGADGKSYTFRSVNKDRVRGLPKEWRETVVARELQDQTSSTHPGVFPFVNGLFAALPWAIEAPQRLVVMPDDPRLGEFRERFRGRVGTFGRYPTAGYQGATEIISSRKLWLRRVENPEVEIDSRLFLRYRVLDMWLGNGDRHQQQWRWAMLPGRQSWRPLFEDPDEVFKDHEGILLWLARWHYPRLLAFKDRISSMEGMAINATNIDRWVLTDLDRDDFLKTAREVKAQLTDEVIDTALMGMPPAWYARSGERLAARLRARRDNLEEGIERFYEYLAAESYIHGTDQNEILRIRRFDDGAVNVSIREHDAVEPYYQRRFVPDDTRALHIYLWGGDDRVETAGVAEDRIMIHVVGGAGDDVFDDSNGGYTRFYDHEGQNRLIAGRDSKLDARPYKNPAHNEETPWVVPRDFGSFTRPEIILGIDPSLDFTIGGGFTTTAWSFRKHPYKSRHQVLARYSSTRDSGAFQYAGSFPKRASKVSFGVGLVVSGIESVNFFGFGNETARDRDDSFFEVDEELLRLAPSVRWEMTDKLNMFFAAELQHTEETSSDTLIAATRPYGSGEFGQLGLIAGLSWDSRGAGPELLSLDRLELDEDAFAREKRTGVNISLEGSYFPEVLDVEGDFSALEGQISGTLGLGEAQDTVLAARVGGRKVWGRFPWREAAFIGGQGSNRGFKDRRFAGDGSLYGSVELRRRLFNALFIVPGRYWIYGLADVGRVWSDADSGSGDEWHLSYGGGMVVELQATSIKFRAELARNDDEDELQFFLKTGFAF